MNIIFILKYYNFTSINPIHLYFSKYYWVYFLYWIYKSHIQFFSNYGFVCQVSFSNDKYIQVKKKKLWEKKSEKGIHQLFVNNLQILSIRQILFLFRFSNVKIHKLLIFLFVEKLPPPIYSYSYCGLMKLFLKWSIKVDMIIWFLLD